MQRVIVWAGRCAEWSEVHHQRQMHYQHRFTLLHQKLWVPQQNEKRWQDLEINLELELPKWCQDQIKNATGNELTSKLVAFKNRGWLAKQKFKQQSWAV